MRKRLAMLIAALLVCCGAPSALAQSSEDGGSDAGSANGPAEDSSGSGTSSNDDSKPAFKGLDVDGIPVSLEGSPDVVRQIPNGAIRDLVRDGSRQFGSYTLKLMASGGAPPHLSGPPRADGAPLLTIFGNGHLEVGDASNETSSGDGASGDEDVADADVADEEGTAPTFAYRPLSTDSTDRYHVGIWPVRHSDAATYQLATATNYGVLEPGQTYSLPRTEDSSILGWRVTVFRPLSADSRDALMRDAIEASKLDRVELGCFPWSASQLVPINTVVVPNASADQILGEVVYGGSFESARTGLDDGTSYYIPVTRIPAEAPRIHWRTKSSATNSGLYGGGFQGLVRLGLGLAEGVAPDEGNQKELGQQGSGRQGMVEIWAADAPPERLKLPCGNDFRTAWNQQAARITEPRDRTEFVRTDALETGEKQTLKLCHETGCHEPKKIVGEITAVPRESWWQPTAFIGLSRGFHHDLDDPATGYEYERASATGGPEEVYRLTHDRTPLQSVMLSLSLGTTLRMWEGSAGNRVFVGITPLTFSGVTFRVLPQLGFTGQWRIYEHLYAGTHLMWRRVDRLLGDEDELAFVTVPRGQEPPDVLTDERWELFVYFGLSLDLAPVTDEVFEAVNEAFGGPS